MKKVGINLLWMVPGVVGGSETYLAASSTDWRSVRPSSTTRSSPFRRSRTHTRGLAKTFKTAYAPVSGSWKSFRVAGENSWLARECRRRHIDLVHHAGGIVPIVRAARPIAHDPRLAVPLLTEYFTRAKLSYLKRMVPRSGEAARLVLTPSEFSRRTVIERMNIDPEHRPRGSARHLPTRVRRRTRGRAQALRGRWAFFLYPAITYPHKNHLVLLEGFARS